MNIGTHGHPSACPSVTDEARGIQSVLPLASTRVTTKQIHTITHWLSVNLRQLSHAGQ